MSNSDLVTTWQCRLFKYEHAVNAPALLLPITLLFTAYVCVFIKALFAK